MCTLPEPAKSTTPMERENSTAGCCVPQVTRKGDSQPCAAHGPSFKPHDSPTAAVGRPCISLLSGSALLTAGAPSPDVPR